MTLNRYSQTFFITLVILLTVLLLAACGSKDEAASSAQPAALATPIAALETAVSAATASPEPETRIVKHALGETEIPAHPQRIASINLEDMLLSLDAPLVLAVAGSDNYYLGDQLKAKNVPVILWSDPFNFEAVLQSDPDLIVAPEWIDKKIYDELTKIAPTIVYNRDNWRVSIKELGAALGMGDKATVLVQAHEVKIQTVKASVAQKVGNQANVALLRILGKTIQVFYPAETGKGYGDALYLDSGFKLHPKVIEYQKVDPTTYAVEISQEVLPELTADYLFVVYGGSASNEAELQQSRDAFLDIAKSKVWQSIPAVKNGHLFEVSPKNWMLNGPIADSSKLDDVLGKLEIK